MAEMNFPSNSHKYNEPRKEERKKEEKKEYIKR